MKLPSNIFKILRWLVLIPVLVFASLLLKEQLLQSPSLVQIQTLTDATQSLGDNYDQILSHASDEDLVLIEMILSLIQNYYVDAKSFQFEELFTRTLGNLRDAGHLTFDQSHTTLDVKVGILQKNIPRRWGEDELGKVASIFQLSSFLRDGKQFSSNKESLVATLNAVISSLDPYSRLLSEEDYRELQEGTEGEFGGLGVMVGVRNNLLTVIKAISHSPASRAGILPDDHILAVNGVTTFGSSLEELIKIMRGLPGTSVTLSLLREGAPSPFDVTLSREIVQVDPVAVQHLKTGSGNDVLMLRLDSFSVKSYNRLRAEIEKIKTGTKSRTDGIILDLRSNPGGLLDQAIKISKLFLKEGAIVTVKGRETETEYAHSEHIDLSCPLIVLINEDSASASEILAAALKDNDRALVIGQPSFGKGTVQTVFELPAGKALKLTIARYLTPSGASIQGVGVRPDIWLHPVYKLDKNENLFGHYRYREEDPFIGFKKSRGDINTHSLLLNGYYLRESNRDPTQSQTREVDLALDIFDHFKRVAVDHSSPQKIVTSLILKKIKAKIESKLRVWDGQVSGFLNAKQVNWETNKANIQSVPRIIDVKTKYVEAFPGQRIPVDFKILNQDPNEASRVSVFIRSHREMDSVEKLLGRISSQKDFMDTMEFEVPAMWAPGRVDFQVGLAINGVESTDNVQSFSLNILSRNEPKLNITSILVGSGESPSRGLLRARSQLKLKVKIENDSDRDIPIEKITMENLSGRQIQIQPESRQQIQSIAAHGYVETLYNVSGTKAIYSDRLGIGFSLESRDLKSPLFKVIYLNAVPNVGPKDRLSVHEK